MSLHIAPVAAFPLQEMDFATVGPKAASNRGFRMRQAYQTHKETRIDVLPIYISCLLICGCIAIHYYMYMKCFYIMSRMPKAYGAGWYLPVRMVRTQCRMVGAYAVPYVCTTGQLAN